MCSKNFEKPALSIPRQLELLQSRGLIITDLPFAKRCLETVSYYRLSVYCKSFQNSDHYFKTRTTFNNVWDLYIFDRELRLLFSDAIELIEVALRTAISNHMSVNYGSLWYLNTTLFKNISTKGSFQHKLQQSIRDICKNPKEDFLQHFFINYIDEFPPSWMIFECLSFGTLSLIFKNLKHTKDKNIIARTLGFHSTLLESWIEALVFTRNICAHHSRLWNRWFLFRPQLPRHQAQMDLKRMHRIYEQIFIIKLLLKSIYKDEEWLMKLNGLLRSFKLVPKQDMGFADNWDADLIWKEVYVTKTKSEVLITS